MLLQARATLPSLTGLERYPVFLASPNSVLPAVNLCCGLKQYPRDSMRASTSPATLLPLSPPAMDDSPAPRRSTRAKKPVAKLENEEYRPPPHTSTPRKIRPASSTNRPKRKAAAMAEETLASGEDPSVVISGILDSLSPDEREEYAGWVEVESDPVSCLFLYPTLRLPPLCCRH